MKDNVILCWCPTCNKFLTPSQVNVHYEADPYEEGGIIAESEECTCELCEGEIHFYEEDEERSVLEFINEAYQKKDLTRLCEVLESYNSWQ